VTIALDAGQRAAEDELALNMGVGIVKQSLRTMLISFLSLSGELEAYTARQCAPLGPLSIVCLMVNTAAAVERRLLAESDIIKASERPSG
jgi:hypothetical protein